MKCKEAINRLAKRVSELLGLEVRVKEMPGNTFLDVISPTGLSLARYNCDYRDEKDEWLVYSLVAQYMGDSSEYKLAWEKIEGMTESVDVNI